MPPQFADSFVRNDREGGVEAATALTHSIGQWLLNWGFEVMPLAVRISGNHEWLSDAYFDAKTIPNRVNYGWFLEGFNSVESLVEFVPIEDRISIPAYRGRGEAAVHKVFRATILTMTRQVYWTASESIFRIRTASYSFLEVSLMTESPKYCKTIVRPPRS